MIPSVKLDAPRKTVLRRFTATVAAAAIALGAFTAAAVPARADNDDIAKALAGIAAIAIIGSALNNDDRGQNTRRVPQHYDNNRDNGWGNSGGRGNSWDDDRRGNNSWGRNEWDRDHKNRDRREVRSRNLPRECVVGRRNGQVVYNQRCLEREGYRR